VAYGIQLDGIGIERMQEIYISTDIEADGPIPGPHSMLSIGAAASDDS
jgi:hypothetical protein